MSYPLSRAMIGAALLCGWVGGVAAATPLLRGAPTAPAALHLVDLDVIHAAAGPLYCLTPSAHGQTLLPVAKVPRRMCLTERDWAMRGVVFADE